MILNLSNNILKCEILTGDKKGEIVFINRITLYSSESDYPFIFKRRQFPVKIAFAMTINKAQGQTFEKIGINLRKEVFNHGQLYAALSRVRSWNSLRIYFDDFSKTNIKNYVYEELIKKSIKNQKKKKSIKVFKLNKVIWQFYYKNFTKLFDHY